MPIRTTFPFRVRIPTKELYVIANAGITRHVQNVRDKKQPTRGCDTSKDWQYHIQGVMGEWCVAKALGIFWEGAGKLGGPDVGGYIEVRTTTGHSSLDHHRSKLRMHPGDYNDRPYFCVTGLNGLYVVHGWIMGQDGKLKEWWSDPTTLGRPAYWVPQEALHKTPYLV